ncbi:hypothetical protein LTR37_015931 [Vermiconidia calcicola]|uniref:Uncharacterized protein n=1 Tax=Vermiconidia calcicola TaxID=1690605 RepID=A0ACC3MPG7_9PEZI|nr:hypothetical protein LTR37_015931 [Vermiconidia calcicola]
MDDWLVEELENGRLEFEDAGKPLLSWQQDSVDTCLFLLREDAELMAGRSKQRRSERMRVRALLHDVFLGISADVFLLCVLAAPISKLAKLTPKNAIPKIRSWWKDAVHPHYLEEVATQLCNEESIVALLTTSRKRRFSQSLSDSHLCLSQTEDINDTSADSGQPLIAATSLRRDVSTPSTDREEGHAVDGSEQILDTGSLTGKVYELTVEDAKSAILRQTAGRVWLTVPFKTQSSPFVTFEVIHKLSRQVAQQRPRMM